jgi:outer membrane protein TolC
LLAAVPCSLAFALQPVATFLAGARRANRDNREAAATTTQRLAEVDVAKGRLYPVFNAAGSYTRNQYEVSLVLPTAGGATGERLTVQPQNQVDGTLTLSVPVIDVGAWRRVSAADATVDATLATQQGIQQDVEAQVYRAYYSLLGQEAVLVASKHTLEALSENLKQVQDKAASGIASELDVQRARAEVARAEGDVASAGLAVTLARRQLATVTFVEPEPASEFVDDDLHEEQPLPGWLNSAGTVPRVASANASQQAASKVAAAAEAAWFPTLSATAQERLTNATSFSGHPAVFLLQATLAWRLDATLSPTVQAQTAAANASAIRADRALRDAQDKIFQAWHQVHAAIERSRAARVQISASRLASELARDRYTVGAATQLEVVQAQQDAFSADVARIQADAELAYARAALRVSAGQFGERAQR